MQFHLVLPGLAWHRPADAPDLPALANLLGHASHTWQPAVTLENWLARHFGADLDRLPYAQLRRSGETANNR